MNKFSEKALSVIFERFEQEYERRQPKDSIELELRFKNITKEVFEDIYKHMSSDTQFTNRQLDCSINFVSENIYERNASGKPDDTQYIRKVSYKSGTPIGNTYYKKSRLEKPVHVGDYLKYTVALNKETIVDGTFPSSTNALVRFKARVSFDFMDADSINWRWDLTAVKTGSMKDLGNNLKQISRAIFTPALAADNLLQELDFGSVDAFELELEYLGKAPTIADMHIVKKAFSVINPQYLQDMAYQDEIYHVAKFIVENENTLQLFKENTHRLKQLSNQALVISKTTYYSDLFPPHGYYATDKADGQRAILSIVGNRARILTSSSMMEFSVESADATAESVTICDCEYVAGESGFTLYIFDAMVVDNVNVSREGFTERLKYLEACANKAQSVLHPNTARAKEFVKLDGQNLEQGFRACMDVVRPYTIEGIILTEPDASYQQTHNYKWKTLDMTTIDFLAVKCPQKMMGIKPYTVMEGRELYLLFVGIDNMVREKLGIMYLPHYRSMFPETGVYQPIQFAPSISPHAYLYYHDPALGDIDRKIVELGRMDDAWVFHKIREDRKLEKNYFGNDYKVAELTYANYVDRFALEDLWKPNKSYFTKTASDMYTASNKYKRFVISCLIKNNLAGARWVIDEGAGRGGDLHRYQEMGVENALFMDVDPTAIVELIRRKFSIFAARKKHVKNWFNERVRGGVAITKYDKIHDVEYEKIVAKRVRSLTVHTMVVDLKTPNKDMIARTLQYGLNTAMVDGVVCNFAFHYMCDTLDHMRNLLLFNAKMIKTGGVFILTVMDGKRVFELLKPLQTGQQWETRENNVLKYAIKKDYKADKLTPCGQMISVLLPFSDEMYQEPLCNVDTVITEAHRIGFEVEVNQSMSAYLDQFASADRSLRAMLTPDDLTYIELHQVITLRLVKPIKNNDA